MMAMSRRPKGELNQLPLGPGARRSPLVGLVPRWFGGNSSHLLLRGRRPPRGVVIEACGAPAAVGIEAADFPTAAAAAARLCRRGRGPLDAHPWQGDGGLRVRLCYLCNERAKH